MGASSLIYKYPLDLTGKSPTNLVLNEPHTIGSDSQRAFVPKCGPFFTASMVVKKLDGTPLVPVEQYLVLQPYQEAAVKSGLDVCSVVYIFDKSAGVDFLIDYQVVGGEFSWATYALRQMIEALELDERPVKWGDIIGKPEAFPPAPHLHDLGDSYGWEYIAEQLEAIRNAILIGDAASHEELRQQIRAMVQEVEAKLDGIEDKIDVHKADFNNPHRVTKVQVGLDKVENLTLASDAEAAAGSSKDRYLTPFGAALLSTRIAGEAVATHASDKTNPHQVTKTQVGLGNVDNYGTATQVQAEAGTATNVFMTPQRTAQAIAKLAGTKLDAHIADKANPHQVTKSQVGLGSVDNYLTASQVEAEAGALNTRFMTPLRTSQAIAAQIGSSFDTHLNNFNNPHQVTAAQLSVYTIAQSNALLAQKLGKTETAVNAGKLENFTKAQILSEAYAAVGTMGKRNVYMSTSDPAAATGAVGDVWLKY